MASAEGRSCKKADKVHRQCERGEIYKLRGWIGVAAAAQEEQLGESERERERERTQRSISRRRAGPTPSCSCLGSLLSSTPSKHSHSAASPALLHCTKCRVLLSSLGSGSLGTLGIRRAAASTHAARTAAGKSMEIGNFPVVLLSILSVRCLPTILSHATRASRRISSLEISASPRDELIWCV